MSDISESRRERRAPRSQQADTKSLRSRLVSSSDEPPDEQFLDDLSAATRFKGFLVGSGSEVPRDVSEGLSELNSFFGNDMKHYEERVRKREEMKSFWVRRLWPRRSNFEG